MMSSDSLDNESTSYESSDNEGTGYESLDNKSTSYPIIDVESLDSSDNESTDSNYKPLGYHGTGTNNVESIMNDGFIRQPQKGLWPHERGVYTSPDQEVSDRYAYDDNGNRGEVFKCIDAKKTSYVKTSMF